MPAAIPANAIPSGSGSGGGPAPPPDWDQHELRWFTLDRLGLSQAIGGFLLGLIALLTSYDHISVFGTRIPLEQQWGVPCIAASLAAVLVDAQLATRSRLRAARDAARAADATARYRDRADRERNRAAQARERQRKSFERLDQAALLSARVQLDPTPIQRARLRTFLTLMAQQPPDDAA